MTCPFNEKSTLSCEGKIMYGDYLKLDKVLNAQRMLSADENGKNPAYDEHLFIIIHQTYELWFKEILYELDLVSDEFSKEKLNASEVIKRLNRIVMILKLLVDQVLILETMTPMDFNDFRQHLDTASGFQSIQFRLIESKLGMQHENRSVFKLFKKDENIGNDLEKISPTPSLLCLIEKWLETTPNLNVLWKHYRQVVEMTILKDVACDDGVVLQTDLETLARDDKNDTALKKMREQFETIFDLSIHDALVKRGDRKLSFDALHAAIVITLYKDDLLFGNSYQILSLLVDIDAMLSRWRYNHVLLVQRMIGSLQMGTGGSSGYQYLRSTLSDRYKPFVDLSNLTTFLISKSDLLPLKQLNVENAPENQRKKGRKSFRRENGNGKRSCNGRQDTQRHKDGGYCTICGSNPNKLCNICIEVGKHTLRDIKELTHRTKDEKKEFESSYESTSSTSSNLNN